MKCRKCIIACCITLIFLASPAVNGATPIPDTGQTRCYDNSQEIPCPQPSEPFYGQDAQYNTGRRSFYTKLDSNAQPLPDSTSDWAMIMDNATGLIWEVKTTDGSIHDKNNTFQYTDAPLLITELNKMGFGGFHDWRLPDVKELSYLVNMSKVTPAFDGEYFPNLILYYWAENLAPSGTPPNCVRFYVQVQNGYVYDYYHADTPGGVMGVRGNGSGVANNFIDNKNGTVSDTTTGLMWQQDSSPQTMNWEQSLAYCENLELAGYNDWWLPNVHELQSIVDYTRYNPAINTGYFPSAKSTFYYSATTRIDNPDCAWTVFFKYGFVDLYFGGDKLTPYDARCVRSGTTSTTTTIIPTTTTSPITSTIQPSTTTTTPPTVINLASFIATPKSGKVILSWSTESETGNAGFNIYRAESEDGAYIKINASLIPAQGSSTQGASYEFNDTNVQNRKTYYYKLEDIDFNGTDTFHGPVSATPRLLYGLK